MVIDSADDIVNIGAKIFHETVLRTLGKLITLGSQATVIHFMVNTMYEKLPALPIQIES